MRARSSVTASGMPHLVNDLPQDTWIDVTVLVLQVFFIFFSLSSLFIFHSDCGIDVMIDDDFLYSCLNRKVRCCRWYILC